MRQWSLQPDRARVVGYFRDGIDARHVTAIRSFDPDAIIFSPGGGPGVLEPSAAAFDAAVACARVIVATAGSQLIAECVAHGIPMLALYREDDDEQRLNAMMLASAGLGHAAPLHALSSALLGEVLAASQSLAVSALPERDAAAAVVDACESLARGT